MKTSLSILLLFLLSALPSWADTVAKDTVSFTTDNVVMEDDPNHGEYCVSLYSADGQWKVQLYYWADHMFGTFGNDDFRLSGNGRYYNFARNPKNDMVFYSFTDMQVTVSDEKDHYLIDANCLTSSATRFLIKGMLPVKQAKDTLAYDLGYASVVTNNFFGTYAFKAETDEWQLEYGVVGNDITGTFYTADLLKPELHDKRTGQDISILSATATHVQRADTLWLTLDALSTDLHLYHLTMYNARRDVEIVGEEDIRIDRDVVLNDLTYAYGCFQLYGQNDDWAVAIAFAPDAVGNGQREWTMADIFMPYTALVRLSDGQQLDIHDIHVSASGSDRSITFLAHITTTDGMLYHVTIPLYTDGYMPEPKETINIDFGDIAILDYTKGLGTVGLGGIVPDQYQLRLYLNAHDLTGDFTTADILPDLCDIMTVSGNTFSFHDAWKVNSHFETDQQGINHVTIDMMTLDSVLYHATMQIPQMQCMADHDYDLSTADFVGILTGKEGDHAEYLLQLQVTDEENDAYNADACYFTFYLAHEGEGLGSEYSYSAGTLATDEPHLFYEYGCEVRVAPEAGTLSIAPVETVTLSIFDQQYRANVYDLSFKFVGQNGVIYTGTTQQYLICIDAEEGDLVEIDEPTLSSLRDVLSQQGYNTEKIYRNGEILILTPKNNQKNEEILYSSDGIRRHALR